MTTFVVIATGQSLTPEQIEHVRLGVARGLWKAVAVSNAFHVAPWAAALVSNDAAWWRATPAAMRFKGRKYSGARCVADVHALGFDSLLGTGLNSGIQGMRVARLLGATRIVLIGFDMRGSHYFGQHPKPLRNTTPERFREFLKQFSAWKGPEVINCTPGSSLRVFPMAPLDQALPLLAEPIAS